jgi:hypothetical protein
MKSSKICVSFVKRADRDNNPPSFGFTSSFGKNPNNEEAFKLIVDVNQTNTGKKMIALLSSYGLLDMHQSDYSNHRFEQPDLFYLTFNTVDGRKGLECVENVEDIESIVLEYKKDCIIVELNRRIGSRKIEIETLKKERDSLCDLIDGMMNDDPTICHAIRGRWVRLQDIDTIGEANEEFDLINKQIKVNHQHIRQIRENMKEIESRIMCDGKMDESCLTIPCGMIGHIKIASVSSICTINGQKSQSFQRYDCYWRHAVYEDDEMASKKRKTMMDINKEDIKNKWINEIM